jgi:hypothetical protein
VAHPTIVGVVVSNRKSDQTSKFVNQRFGFVQT